MPAAHCLEWVGRASRWCAGPVTMIRAAVPGAAAAAGPAGRASGARAPARETLSACSCRLRDAPFEIGSHQALNFRVPPPRVGFEKFDFGRRQVPPRIGRACAFLSHRHAAFGSRLLRSRSMSTCTPSQTRRLSACSDATVDAGRQLTSNPQ